MNEILEKIVVERIELKQYRSFLYQLIVCTNDRTNCYVHGAIDRREEDSRIDRIALLDSMNPTSIITIRLSAKDVIDVAKIIKEYFDDTNRKIEKINNIVERRKRMVKMAIAVIFAKMVED